MIYERIDISIALEQLGGSDKLYKTLVNGFYNKYQSVDKDVEKLIDQGDMDEARRLVHSIKGLSGNLGANTLRERALSLEYSIRDKSDQIWEHLGLFSSELKAVIKEVEAIRVERYQVDDSPKSEELNYEEGTFLSVCRELLSALETYKYGEVKSSMAKFSATKVPAKHQGSTRTVTKHVDNYDYDRAIDLLKEMV